MVALELGEKRPSYLIDSTILGRLQLIGHFSIRMILIFDWFCRHRFVCRITRHSFFNISLFDVFFLSILFVYLIPAVEPQQGRRREAPGEYSLWIFQNQKWPKRSKLWLNERGRSAWDLNKKFKNKKSIICLSPDQKSPGFSLSLIWLDSLSLFFSLPNFNSTFD